MTENYLEHLKPVEAVEGAAKSDPTPEQLMAEAIEADKEKKETKEVETPEQSEEQQEVEALNAAETDEPEEEKEDPAPKIEKRDRSAEKRIAKLIAERERLKGQVEAMRHYAQPSNPDIPQRPVIDPNAPNPNNYQNGVDDIDFKVDMKLYQRDMREKQTQFQNIKMELMAKYPNLDELIDEDNERVRAGIPTANPTVVNLIHESENPGELWHYLLSHPEEAIKIARMDPIHTAKNIAKIEAGLENPAPTKPTPKKVAALPAPITPVKANKPNVTVGSKNFGFTEY